jgi:subtilisin family serine protease
MPERGAEAGLVELIRSLFDAQVPRLAAAGERDATLTAQCEAARRMASAAACSLAVVEADGRSLRYVAASGRGAAAIIGTRLAVSTGIAGYVAASGQALEVGDVRDDPRFAADVAERTGFVPQSLLVLPLMGADDEVTAVLSILDRAAEALPAWTETFLPGRLGPAPHLDLAGVDRPWAFGDGSGRGVRVAIVDSGIDATHPLVGPIQGGVVVQHDPGAETGVRYEEGAHDDVYGHGTACAAIVRELAPECELYSVRVLGERLTGKAGIFAYGLDWCIEHGMDVVNLSLSTTNHEWFATFHDLCDQATYGRVLLVSALANERKPSYPSEFSSVFSVAATPTADRSQWWCNPEPPAEWGAAGLDVDVAWQDHHTIRASGNSFAAPVIAGHLARLRGAHPGITCWQARTVLAALAANAQQ